MRLRRDLFWLGGVFTFSICTTVGLIAHWRTQSTSADSPSTMTTRSPLHMRLSYQSRQQKVPIYNVSISVGTLGRGARFPRYMTIGMVDDWYIKSMCLFSSGGCSADKLFDVLTVV